MSCFTDCVLSSPIMTLNLMCSHISLLISLHSFAWGSTPPPLPSLQRIMNEQFEINPYIESNKLLRFKLGNASAFGDYRPNMGCNPQHMTCKSCPSMSRDRLPPIHHSFSHLGWCMYSREDRWNTVLFYVDSVVLFFWKFLRYDVEHQWLFRGAWNPSLPRPGR